MKARGMGSVYRLKGRKVWRIKYYFDGRCIRESSHSTVKKHATALLKKRITEMGSGRFVGPAAEKVVFEDLAKMLTHDYRANGYRSLKRAEQAIEHLRGSFGDSRALAITP